MNSVLFFATSITIQVHVAAAVSAFAVGLAQFVGRKGRTAHRVLGWTWVILVAVTAVSSFWIVDFRNLRPTALILLLSIAVIVQLPLGVWAARQHQIARHKTMMTWLYINALIIAGVFTLLPGRLMYRLMFG